MALALPALDLLADLAGAARRAGAGRRSRATLVQGRCSAPSRNFTELPEAPQLVLELLFEDLDHDRVVEEAEAGDLVRDQVFRVGEVRERAEHLGACGALASS